MGQRSVVNSEDKVRRGDVRGGEGMFVLKMRSWGG